VRGASGVLRRGFCRRPILWGIATWLLSVLSGATALALANFGGPAWIFVAIGLWLWTVGLPTLAAVLGIVFIWGSLPEQPAHSFAWATLAALFASCALQVGAARFLARLLRLREAS